MELKELEFMAFSEACGHVTHNVLGRKWKLPRNDDQWARVTE